MGNAFSSFLSVLVKWLSSLWSWIIDCLSQLWNWISGLLLYLVEYCCSLFGFEVGASAVSVGAGASVVGAFFPAQIVLGLVFVGIAILCVVVVYKTLIKVLRG